MINVRGLASNTNNWNKNPIKPVCHHWQTRWDLNWNVLQMLELHSCVDPDLQENRIQLSRMNTGINTTIHHSSEIKSILPFDCTPSPFLGSPFLQRFFLCLHFFRCRFYWFKFSYIYFHKFPKNRRYRLMLDKNYGDLLQDVPAAGKNFVT